MFCMSCLRSESTAMKTVKGCLFVCSLRQLPRVGHLFRRSSGANITFATAVDQADDHHDAIATLRNNLGNTVSRAICSAHPQHTPALPTPPTNQPNVFAVDSCYIHKGLPGEGL